MELFCYYIESSSNNAFFFYIGLLQRQKRVHEFREEANYFLVNQVVMTIYNKKTYTVGGVETGKSVNSPYKSDGTGETFVEYYKRVLFFVVQTKLCPCTRVSRFLWEEEEARMGNILKCFPLGLEIWLANCPSRPSFQI